MFSACCLSTQKKHGTVAGRICKDFECERNVLVKILADYWQIASPKLLSKKYPKSTGLNFVDSVDSLALYMANTNGSSVLDETIFKTGTTA